MERARLDSEAVSQEASRPTGERARLWQRVSTGGQDEANQLPDLITWCDSHGYIYDLDERYVLHGKSAWKGKQAKTLDRAIDDMASGLYTVLVVWQSSRIERRGAWNAFDLARRVRDAGGRIEYVQDTYLNDATEMSDVMLALAATKDKQESRDKSVRTLASQAAKRAAGSVVGRACWGYAIEQRGTIKILVPTSTGRKYVPVIFQLVIDGKSLRFIARWLDSEDVKPMRGQKWNEGFIGNKLIKNPTYYGCRPNAGNLDVEALVSVTTWQAANQALKSRIRGHQTKTHEKTLVSPVCGACFGQPREGCTSGVSPMYRVFVGKEPNRDAYYRCTGQGPQRKGCGAPLARVSEVDALVTEAMSTNPDPHFERVFVPGDDRSDEIAKLRLSLDRAKTRDESNRIWDKIEELESLPSSAPHWDFSETSISEGQYFAGLPVDERRDYLAARYDIHVRREAGRTRVDVTERPYVD